MEYAFDSVVIEWRGSAPVKDALRKPEHIGTGDTVTLSLVLGR